MDESDELSPWKLVPGAETVYERLGWWPNFHDATMLWVRFDQEVPGRRFAVRLELNEGGPLDRITLAWQVVDSFVVQSWEYSGPDVYFTESELSVHPDGAQELRLSGPCGDWTIKGRGLAVQDHEHGPPGDYPPEG
jgi:hypothetical protein